MSQGSANVVWLFAAVITVVVDAVFALTVGALVQSGAQRVRPRARVGWQRGAIWLGSALAGFVIFVAVFFVAMMTLIFSVFALCDLPCGNFPAVVLTGIFALLVAIPSDLVGAYAALKLSAAKWPPFAVGLMGVGFSILVIGSALRPNPL